MSERWVQHKSGQGEKWKLVIQTAIEHDDIWAVKMPGKMLPVYFPKSEYIECAPPEVWVECTREVASIHGDGSLSERETDIFKTNVVINMSEGYRWSWRGNALVIERRQP
jgi:hypothetical protein